ADGLAEADALALGLALLLPLALGVGLEVAPGRLAPHASFGKVPVTGWSVVVWSTLRKVSLAGATIFFRSSALVPPATLTTRRRSPSVTTSGSDTPLALTRFAMIERAWSRLAELGALLSGVSAESVIAAPPCRSRPSFGVGFLLP